MIMNNNEMISVKYQISTNNALVDSYVGPHIEVYQSNVENNVKVSFTLNYITHCLVGQLL